MKKCLTAVLAALFIIVSVLPVGAEEPGSLNPPVIGSEAVVVMDARTGQILFEKNMHERLYPASITKIMTVLLGVEKAQPDEVITMSHDAVFSLKLGASHIALDEGEQISMEQALMAAMLPSANDACNGIAEHISGSIPAFVQLMNQRAVQAGALNTTFANTNGLYDPGHLTTAYDMAMITWAAIQNPEFGRIFGTSYYVIAPTNQQPETRYLWAEHKMFKNGRYEYPGVIGGKTGYTRESGNTLVTLARRGERELIVVAIRSVDHAVYIDTAALLDYGFDRFDERPIIMPAVTFANPNGTPAETRLIEDASQQVQEMNITRLLHKNVSPADIKVDYTLLNPGEPDAQIQVNMRLGSGSNLMYGDLGSALLEIPARAAAGNIALNILATIAKTMLVLAAIAFGLRWFFKSRRAPRRRRELNLNPERIRMPLR
ncbi:MAG: D-alanyl-D-alanine carboxypeptidase family protein [Syntrophomonadaceae bacterium]